MFTSSILLEFLDLFKLSRSYAPEESEVQQDITDGVLSVLQDQEESTFLTLSNTIVLIDNSTVSSLQVTG